MERIRNREPTQIAVASAIVVLTMQLSAMAAYIRIQQPMVTELRALAYPVVWITTGTTTAVWIGLTVQSRQRRGLGLAVGGLYTMLLLWLGGIVDWSAGIENLMIQPAMPGWGPLIHYQGEVIALSVVPFKTVAYLALGYVVYVLVAGSQQSVRAAALGVASCVGCTAPVAFAVAGGVGGTQSASLVATTGYGLGTLVLVGTCGLLVRAAHRTQGRCRLSQPTGGSQR